jgi:hypothetical protein
VVRAKVRVVAFSVTVTVVAVSLIVTTSLPLPQVTLRTPPVTVEDGKHLPSNCCTSAAIGIKDFRRELRLLAPQERKNFFMTDTPSREVTIWDHRLSTEANGVNDRGVHKREPAKMESFPSQIMNLYFLH